MYKIIPLTLKERVEIPVGAVVELEVNEFVEVPASNGIFRGSNSFENYATFHIRKSIAKKGVLQYVTSPFKEGFSGKPTITVKNDYVNSIELLKGEEIGEIFIWSNS